MGVRLVDRETNTYVVDIRPLREEVRTDIIHACSKGIQVPSSGREFSSWGANTEESILRPQLPIPQLDGPTSVCTRRKQPIPMAERRTIIHRGGYPDESDSDSHDNRTCENRRYPGRGRHHWERSRDCQKELAINVEVIQGVEDPLMVEVLLMVEVPLMMEAPLMMKAPLMVEDPQEMEEHQEDQEDKDHQVHQDCLDQYAQ